MNKQFSYLDLLPLYEVYYKNHSYEKFFKILNFLCKNNPDLLLIIEKFSINYSENTQRYKSLSEEEFGKKMKTLSHVLFDKNNKANYDWTFNELKEYLRNYLLLKLEELEILHRMKLYNYCILKNMEIADHFLDEYSTFEVSPIDFKEAEVINTEVGKLVV